MACMMAFICCQMFKNLETKEDMYRNFEKKVSDLKNVEICQQQKHQGGEEEEILVY